MALAVDVLDQDHLAGADLARFAVAGGDLDASVEIDDGLPARGGMPIKVVSRRHFAKDDPGRRQSLGQFAAAGLFDPFDLDITPMRLAAFVGIEIVDAQGRPSHCEKRARILAAQPRSAPASRSGAARLTRAGWPPRPGWQGGGRGASAPGPAARRDATMQRQEPRSAALPAQIPATMPPARRRPRPPPPRPANRKYKGRRKDRRSAPRR